MFNGGLVLLRNRAVSHGKILNPHLLTHIRTTDSFVFSCNDIKKVGVYFITVFRVTNISDLKDLGDSFSLKISELNFSPPLKYHSIQQR